MRIARRCPSRPKNSTRAEQRIEHLKLMVEKFRHMIFGKKSEKLVLKLEQMEFELEEDETTQAEAEAIAERVAPHQGSEASFRTQAAA